MRTLAPQNRERFARSLCGCWQSYFAASILLITIAFDPPRSKTFPLATTVFPANGSSLSFWLLEGVVSAIGQYMTPLGASITRGDPAFAQAIAHSELIGFFKPFVNAQAESSTYPLTVTVFADCSVANSPAARSSGMANLTAVRKFIFNLLT
jgi:hypothetical protein